MTTRNSRSEFWPLAMLALLLVLLMSLLPPEVWPGELRGKLKKASAKSMEIATCCMNVLSGDVLLVDNVTCGTIDGVPLRCPDLSELIGPGPWIDPMPLHPPVPQPASPHGLLLEAAKLLLPCLSTSEDIQWRTLEYRTPADELRWQADKIDRCDSAVSNFRNVMTMMGVR